jgi:hypothetical protein
MTLPLKVYLTDLNSVDGTEFITNWMDNNRELLHNAVFHAAKRFEIIPTLKSVTVIEIYYVGDTDETEEIIADVELDPSGLQHSLDECINWYVETEQYEMAAECKKLQETFQKRKYE